MPDLTEFYRQVTVVRNVYLVVTGLKKGSKSVNRHKIELGDYPENTTVKKVLPTVHSKLKEIMEAWSQCNLHLDYTEIETFNGKTKTFRNSKDSRNILEKLKAEKTKEEPYGGHERQW